MSRCLLLLPTLGLLIALARWVSQGSFNVYTDPSKRFYVPDEALGWRVVESGPTWLGLDLVAAIAAIVALAFALQWVAARRELPGVATWVMALLGVVAWVPGVAAFASGGRPDGGVERPPAGVVEVPEGVSGGLAGLPSGSWSLASLSAQGKAGIGIIAEVSAGGETFETRFEAVKSATFVGDPSDLRQPLRATIVVDPASVDTGIEGRSKHAREYLQVEAHPEMRFELLGLTGAASQSDAVATIAARGQLEFMGRSLEIETSGELRRLDESARRHLGIDAEYALSVTTSFVLPLESTPLQADADSFSSDEFPIRVSLVFVPDEARG